MSAARAALRLGAALLLPGALLAACGGDAAGPTEAVTAADLAVMALPWWEMPEIADGFVVAEDRSGVIENATFQQDVFGPPPDSAGLGRLTGYKLEYDTPFLVDVVAADRGILGVDTTIDLFADADGAIAFSAAVATDFPGFEIQDQAIADLADGARSVRVIGRSENGVHTSGFTAVFFRLDRLAGRVVLVHLGEDDFRATAETLARRLVQRIQRVLDGEPLRPAVPPASG